jgi:hypothetical protein
VLGLDRCLIARVSFGFQLDERAEAFNCIKMDAGAAEYPELALFPDDAEPFQASLEDFVQQRGIQDRTDQVITDFRSRPFGAFVADELGAGSLDHAEFQESFRH